MLGIQMICIIIGIIMLVVGTVAFLKIPSLMATPLGAIGLFIWLIIMILILEYARLSDPWYDSIIITVVEISGVIVTAWFISNGVEKNMNRRFKEYKKGQRTLYRKFEQQVENKLDGLEITITEKLNNFEKTLNQFEKRIEEKLKTE